MPFGLVTEHETQNLYCETKDNDVVSHVTTSVFKGLRHRRFPSSLFLSYESTKKKRVYRNAGGTVKEANTTIARYLLKSLPFVPLSIELTVHRMGYGWPSYNIRVQHCLSHEAYWSKFIPAVMNQDLAGFRELLQNGDCAIDSRFSTLIRDYSILEASHTRIAVGLKRNRFTTCPASSDYV